MWLKIFNTLRGEKENFFPLTESEAGINVSSVTVYDSPPSHKHRILLADLPGGTE
jgi:cysteinyl-tRNA synthetase